MIFIRADANEKIGTGHVMRCLSIARAFIASGHNVLFITADHRGDRLINSAGFSSVCMDTEWTKMEQESIRDLLIKFQPNLLLVDSYFVSEEYFKSISQLTRIVYIDDINANVWDVDYLINYNIYGTVLDYTAYDQRKTKLLLGPIYTPLRPEFQNIPFHSIKHVTDVMISTGGADPEGISEKLISSICTEWKDIRFHFVIGALNPGLERIKRQAKPNMVLHINEKNISRLMQSCDIAISAAGMTLYELCATGTPTITYSLADNQLIAAEEFEKKSIMTYAGDCRRNENFLINLKEKLHELINDDSKRQLLSEKMQTLVDGRGAERLARSLSDFLMEETMDS